jgi:heme exporter protein A
MTSAFRADDAPALSVAGLACERGERTLFEGLDFTLAAGEALLVVGGNGHGKTSLLRILAGLSLPAVGEVRWCGAPIRAVREAYSRALAWLGHADGIKADLTPLETLQLAAALRGRALDAAAAQRALDRVALARCAELPARVLSFGQRRRVALAALTLAEARLWILDEPLAGLDAQGVGMVQGLLDAHLAAGGLAVVTTHQNLALAACAPRTLRIGAC